MNGQSSILNGRRLMGLAVLVAAAFSGGCASAAGLADSCKPFTPKLRAKISPEQKTKADDYWEYANLSNNVYKPAGHPEIWVDPNVWEPICEETLKTTNAYGLPDCKPDNPVLGKGLEAKTYLKWPHGRHIDQPSELVFVFRGTTSFADWWYGNIWDRQYGDADQYVKERIARYPGIKVVATGHSLGGGLAQHVAFCFENATAVAFNASPRSHKHDCERHLSPTQEQDIKKNNVVRIHQHDELLSFIRHIFSSRDYPDTSYNFAGGSPITRHGMTSLAMGLTELAGCPVEKGLNGFSAPAKVGVEAVPTRTCASQSMEFHCASTN